MVKNKTGLIRLFVSYFTNCEKNIPIINNDEEHTWRIEDRVSLLQLFSRNHIAVLQYHAITGCDTTSFFYRIGKINPVFEKSICLKFN